MFVASRRQTGPTRWSLSKPSLSTNDASDIGGTFNEKAVRQDRRSNIVDVLGRHAAGEEAVAPVPDNIDDSIDFPASLLHRKPEPPRLRQTVFVPYDCVEILMPLAQVA